MVCIALMGSIFTSGTLFAGERAARRAVQISHFSIGRRYPMRTEHWQDVVSLFLGAWLVLSPLAMRVEGAAAWFTVALGLSVMLFAIEGLVIPSYLEELAEICVGLALIIVPWTTGFESPAATFNSVVPWLVPW